MQTLLGELAEAKVVAVDTESNSMHAYREQVCLIQITAKDVDWIVDPLAVDVAPLGELFADPSREKIFHAAEYDVICLRRDFGWSFASLFDTMLAARILAWPKFGLGAVLDEHFGVRLNKKMQRHDWGRRPLTPPALSYARLDTHFLHRLRAQQLEALIEQGRVDEARAAFARVADSEATTRPYDLDGFWKIKGAFELDDDQAAALRELWALRDRLAQRLDRPHFKIVNDAALLATAQGLPQDADALRRLPDVPGAFSRRHGRDVIDALRRAAKRGAPPRPARKKRSPPTPTDQRLDQLMRWRKRRAAERGVETDVIATKKILRQIAERDPTDAEQLREIEAFDAWQLDTYGDEVLVVLADARPTTDE